MFRKSLGSTAFLANFSISNYRKSAEHMAPNASRTVGPTGPGLGSEPGASSFRSVVAISGFSPEL